MLIDTLMIPVALFFGIPALIGEILGIMNVLTMPMIIWSIVVWIWLWAIISLILISCFRIIGFIFHFVKRANVKIDSKI